MDKNTMNKLKKWIDEHPEESDTPQINLTTQKEFTIREILEQEMDAQKKAVLEQLRTNQISVTEAKEKLEKLSGD